MGKQIVGLDLSKVADYRERVEVGVVEGKTVLLPLIELRDAHLAELFLSRLDAIRTEWAVLIAAYNTKAGMYQGLKKKAESADPSDGNEVSPDEYFASIETVAAAIQESQKKQAGLIRKIREITTEIHDFLSPYLAGTGVIEQLQKVDDALTQKVLYAMLFGAAALKENEDEEESAEDVKKN